MRKTKPINNIPEKQLKSKKLFDNQLQDNNVVLLGKNDNPSDVVKNRSSIEKKSQPSETLDSRYKWTFVIINIIILFTCRSNKLKQKL